MKVVLYLPYYSRPPFVLLSRRNVLFPLSSSLFLSASSTNIVPGIYFEGIEEADEANVCDFIFIIQPNFPFAE